MSNTDNSDCSIYFYNPSLAAAILFTVLYALPTVFTLHRINNYRTWYFLPVIAGGVFEVVGYALRIASTKSSCSTGLYASSQTLIIVAPLLVAAGNYIMLPRLMIAVLPLDFNVIFGLKPLVITAIFLVIDLVSIAIQAVGSGIASTHNWIGTERTTGVDILIAGLAIQVATVIIFLFLCWVFSDRAYFGGGQRPDAPALADRAFKAICISSTLIAVRSIYRLVEFALGIDAYPFTTEWPFYVFEAVPMLGALSIYCLWFPPAYVPRHKFGNPADVEIGKTNGHRSSAPVTPMVQSAAASMLAGQTSPPMARSPAHSIRRHEVPVLRSNNPSRAGSRATSRATSPVRGHHDTLSPGMASGTHTPAHHSHAPATHEPPIQEAFKPSAERYA